MNFLPGILAGGLGALFGGGQDEPESPQLSPEQRQLLRQWRLLIRREGNQSRRAPLTTGVERQGLAQAQGLQSQAARQTREGLFSQMGAADLQSPAAMDALKNLGQAELAGNSNIYSNALQSSLQNREQHAQRQASYLQGAGSIANNPAIPGYQQQGGGFEQMLPLLGQFGAQWGMRGSRTPPFDPYQPTGSTSVDPFGGRSGQRYY